MAGRHPKNSKATAILFLLSLALLFLIFTIFSSSSSPSSPSAFTIPRTPHSHSSSIDYSFVSSLQKFLSTKPTPDNPEGGTHDDALVAKLDDSISEMETKRLLDPDPFFPVSLPIKVYVYRMPSKFTYDLLWLFHNTYRDTSNLTSNGSPVHRLIEQHSIDYWLWADLIAPESERPLKNLVVRVDRQEEADLFYIPFFTTISFFLLEKQQCKALYRVKL